MDYRERKLTDSERMRIRLSSNDELTSIINLGYNGHPNFWLYAQQEADKRKVYFIQNIIQLEGIIK